MKLKTASILTAQTGSVKSLSARLSARWGFQAVLIALLLVTWSLSDTHNAIMAISSPAAMSEMNASAATAHHTMGHHHQLIDTGPDSLSLADTGSQHDHCADHCLSVMMPVAADAASLLRVSLSPERQPFHWQPWRADLTPPPPKSMSLSV